MWFVSPGRDYLCRGHLGYGDTQEHLNKIFRQTHEVVFCFDGDRAGLKAAWRALEKCAALAWTDVN